MQHPRSIVLLSLMLAACGEAPQVVVSPAGAARSAPLALSSAPAWSAWSTATPLTELNTSVTDGCPYLSRSGHALYFASNRPGGFGALDLYVSYWDAAAGQWGPAINLGPEINTAANEQCPLLLQNGKEMMFVSNRPGGVGGLDLWIADMHDQRDATSWEPARNLTELNSTADEFGPGTYQEGGRTVVYFNSNRTGGVGGHDLYVSTEQRDGTFSAPVAAAGLNTSSQEQFAALSGDGLEIVFASDRAGTLGGLDLWYATRTSTSEPWSTPVNLGPQVNGTAVEGRSTLSWDGRTLIFNSSRSGNVDLYVATRERGVAP